MTPFEPTTAVPGSEAKIAVLTERYERGLPLFDSRDATYEDDSREPYHDREQDHETEDDDE